MPTAGQAQPDVMPFLRFRLDDVVVLENGLSPSAVIEEGTPFTLRVDVGFDGLLAPLVTGQAFSVFHHITNIETNATQTEAGGAFVPTAANLTHITAQSGPISLAIPAGFEAGTFRILTHVHADNAAVRPIVAAFHDGLVVMIT